MPRYTDHGKLVWGIPYALNLPKLLQQYPPIGFKPIPDHFYHIVDYMINMMEYQDLDESGGYVNLNAHKMQRYNKHYKKYLKFLKSRGILESDNYFIVGEKSRGYLITPYYLSVATQEIPVQKLTLIKKLRKDLQSRRIVQQDTEENYQHLTKWFNSNLEIDVAAARRAVKEIYPIKRIGGSIGGYLKGTGKLKFKRYKAYQSIERLTRKDFYYSVDSSVGRFHSNLTNLKKDLRTYLTYEDKPLGIVDIANAQPLFSALLLKKEFYTGELELNLKKILSSSSISPSPSYLHSLTSHLSTYITLQLFPESEAHSSFQPFLTSVQEGTFYKLAHQKMFSGEPYQKRKVKESVFATFFSHNRFIGQKEAIPKKLFAQAFPEVYHVFKRIKRGNHVLLSHLLQRIESYIMVETVARRIAQERQELPIYTIHDGIATIKGEEGYVKRVMEEEILRLTGLHCNITIEQ